ncbi:acyltransferase family protein [Marinococcus halophilus]|uniref:acyltransferase family protein n=1 Tax=Marinococcus halophilus TaxID=1371 RepID=UPI00360A1164
MESEQNNLTQRRFRPEIEGLRAVAALLVAIYHIWVGQVSGGVDVFFVVSGFLITTSLVNRLEKNGSIDFFSFILRLMKRLFPMAFLVLLVTSLASILWLPQVRWSQTIQEVFASAFYYQNWQLAINSVDYLAQNNEASPFQHFWAMSIQGQFYLLWPLVLFIAYLAAKYIFKISTRVALTGVLTGLFAVSFSYSIYRTAVDQPWAYFDTLARVWEFSLGGLLAIMISKIILNKLLSAFLGWAGLFAIIVTGAALEVSTEFPGYAALWPVVGGILIVATGNQGGALGVHRLLSWGPLTKFGSISYAFYLWHWPLLIFYYILTDTKQVPFFDGLLLMVGAALISYVSTVLIEKPIRTMKLPAKHWLSWGTVVICMLPTLIVASWWAYDVDQSNEELANAVEDENYPEL